MSNIETPEAHAQRFAAAMRSPGAQVPPDPADPAAWTYWDMAYFAGAHYWRPLQLAAADEHSASEYHRTESPFGNCQMDCAERAVARAHRRDDISVPREVARWMNRVKLTPEQIINAVRTCYREGELYEPHRQHVVWLILSHLITDDDDGSDPIAARLHHGVYLTYDDDED